MPLLHKDCQCGRNLMGHYTVLAKDCPARASLLKELNKESGGGQCTKHGECQGCLVDELQDKLKHLTTRINDLGEEFHDKERAERGNRKNSD